MRLAALLATAVLVVGCSHTVTGRPEADLTSTPTPPATPSTSTSAAQPTGTDPADPPAAGAEVTAVIAWVEVGRRVDAATFHHADRDAVTTDLGDDIAFTSGSTRCMTDQRYAENTLICLVDLTDPPPKPETGYGEWKGGWVQFDGASAQVGSFHGDPGPFLRGDGPELPDGQTLAFGDYRCRPHRGELFCVDYAHQSAVRLSAAGVEPFGCLQSVPAPEGVGVKFSC